MPLTSTTSCGAYPMALSELYTALSTPKSPQPGHHVGLTPLLYSSTVRSVVKTSSGMDRGLLAPQRSVRAGRSARGNHCLQHAGHAERLPAIHIQAREFHVLIVRF